jgi:hypothetical protein
MEEEEMQGGQCPIATRDITINLQNRGKAIDKANYGPMNPREPNDRYWQQLAAKWDVPVEEAQTMRCGNCAAFNQTRAMMACIEQGLGEGQANDPMETVEAGNLGFCEIFDFKCAAERTCDAWIVGGPITDEEEGDEYGEAEEYEESDDSEYEES